MSIRNRLLLILALIGLSVFYLVPRNVTVRERDLPIVDVAALVEEERNRWPW